MAAHNKTGQLGEALALEYFTGLGYHILDRSWRHGHWEIDLIASKGVTVHFIEVKTRRSKQFGLPEASISTKKIQNLLNAASAWLRQHPQWEKIRIDVLAISLDSNDAAEFFLIEDVYV